MSNLLLISGILYLFYLLIRVLSNINRVFNYTPGLFQNRARKIDLLIQNNFKKVKLLIIVLGSLIVLNLMYLIMFLIHIVFKL